MATGFRHPPSPFIPPFHPDPLCRPRVFRHVPRACGIKDPNAGFSPSALAPLNPLPSPVTLLQVEDVIATSDMVWELHSHHLPPPTLSFYGSPSSSEMAVDEVEESSLIKSCASSFDPWTESHPAPSISGSLQEWETWLDDALDNRVLAFRLAKFMKMLSITATLPLGQAKFAWSRL
jgi:hypothetical protein